ncbi:hypothetical protein FDECE_2444 [Fusarium decemcellulare]|nr:hypothetical protein FDECE_2444 [Fusarium decemcellulare]
MGQSCILDWTEPIASPPTRQQDTSSDRPRKRLRHAHYPSDLVHTKKRSPLLTLLTSESLPLESSTDRDRNAMAPKRSRSPDSDENEQSRDRVHINLTPRPPRSSIFSYLRDVDAHSQASSITSSKVSKISRNSSSAKRLRVAELRETGSIRASFDDDEEHPISLEPLVQQLRDIDEGYGILPRDLQSDLAGERVRPWMFGDKLPFRASDLPDVRIARKIYRLARRCFLENLSESSWNTDVHSKVLEWVLRDSSSSDELLDYRCCSTAEILPEYRPEHAPSKAVDFCICIQPEADSEQHDTIHSLCRNRPAMSINHTDWGDLTKNPIAISIVAKGPEQSYDTALLQVATWHSSQWESLCWGRQPFDPIDAIEFMAGIIVIKHDWYFVATDLDGKGHARTFERLPLGSTETVLGIYKLSMALLTLLQWARKRYWPAFQSDILEDIEEEGTSILCGQPSPSPTFRGPTSAMASIASVDVDTKVQKGLEGTKFQASTLKKLAGGSVNWIYLAELSTPLDDGTTEVLVKHGEPYMATKPEFPLTLLRCSIEVETLRSLSGCSSFGTSDSTAPHNFIVRTPNFYHFDYKTSNQIQEFLPNGIDLKEYALRHYSAPTPQSLEPQCRQLGSAVGRWLKGFVKWSAQQTKHRELVAWNGLAQDVRHMVNFAWLYDRIKDFPAILDDVKDTLEEVEQMAAAERKDESKHQIIHGDFWMGNIVLPNAQIQEGTKVPLFVIDWECTQLGLPSVDFGQMIAEMYALWLYKSITAGLWMMEGFINAYGTVSQDFAFRAAIQTGTHLLCITTTFPGWGTPEQVEKVACVGRDIIVHAWKKDHSWFEKSELACLFRPVADR